jgi:hypothetical protein
MRSRKLPMRESPKAMRRTIHMTMEVVGVTVAAMMAATTSHRR